MDFEKIAYKCRGLNKIYGRTQSVFVSASILSLISIYFFIISPLLKLIIGDPWVGFLPFALLLFFSIHGIPLVKNEHYEFVVEYLYKKPKIFLTFITIFCVLLLHFRSIIFCNKTFKKCD